MRTDMRVVSPFRPFVPESQAHRLLGKFDWVEALRMLAVSVEQSCHCETLAITDVDTALPVPMLQFQTTHRRLMLWILEVSLRYLESQSFDRDTIMISPDTLVFGDLSKYFAGDLGVIVRSQEKYQMRFLLNGVQFWAHDGKDRLVAFYRDVLALAETLPDNVIQWGADTVPLQRLLAPVQIGCSARHGLTVHMIERGHIMQSLSALAITRMAQGLSLPNPEIPVLDFKYLRKKYMAKVFRVTVGQAVSV